MTSPVLVQGRGAAYEQNLVLRVLDATGYEIGKGNAMIDGPLGAIGPYSGVVTFTVPASTQPGRIQVYSQSPADGAIEHLTSVTVMLQGAGLDEAVEQLKVALEGEDYDALALLMTDPWTLGLFPLREPVLQPQAGVGAASRPTTSAPARSSSICRWTGAACWPARSAWRLT